MRQFEEIRKELQASTSEKGHPYKYGTLGTVGLEMMPRLRTVVLREIEKDLSITFYTDYRSKKIIHIKENPKVSLLLYHPEKQLQLKIEGLASFTKGSDKVRELWSDLHEKSKKDYTTTLPPGSTISGPDEIEYLHEENYLCKVTLEPYKIEYLKLGSPHHTRIRFSRKKSDQWDHEYLIP